MFGPYAYELDESITPQGMINKVKFDQIPEDAIAGLAVPDYENIIKVSVAHSDAVIAGSEPLNPSLTKFIESTGKPFLPFAPKEKFAEAYTAFYRQMLAQ